MPQESDTGAAAVEFAIVVPILLTIVFGIITWGLIFAAQISLNTAARDAARAGVVGSLGASGSTGGITCSVIANQARQNALTLGVAPISVGVTVTSPNGTSCTLPQNVTTIATNGTEQMCLATSGQLVVALTYTAVSPVPLVPPQSIALTATGAFQCEYS
jgi:Flp pilus assembly protein TadG